jgi:hypothetical protein
MVCSCSLQCSSAHPRALKVAALLTALTGGSFSIAAALAVWASYGSGSSGLSVFLDHICIGANCFLPPTNSNLLAAMACLLLGFCFSLIACVLSLLHLCGWTGAKTWRKCLRPMRVISSTLAFIFTLCGTVIAPAFFSLPSTSLYGPGFAVSVTGTVLQLLALVLTCFSGGDEKEVKVELKMLR